MRPERLRLAAFGAYAGEQEIDFAELGDHRLFLIHGPTGSGKTTLLDAICFALFGESSGDERDASDLRSHHAAPTRPTEVEFDFSLGAEAFRIRRFPAQSLPGRGGRPVARTPEVTLWRRGSDESLSVLAEKVTPVREALTELLGYTAAEFRQVVMLPQGRFRELLVAERGARKDILATLFRTAFYRRVEEALAAMERDAREEVKAAEATRSALMSEAGAETVAEAALPGLAAEAEIALAEAKAAEDEATAAAEALRVTGERKAAAAATLAALRNALPPDAGDAEALGARIASANGLAEALRESLDRDRAEHAAATEAIERARSDLAEAIARRNSAAAEAQAAGQAFLAACRSAGFADLDAWRDARRTTEEIEALEREVTDFGERLAAARQAAETAYAAAAGRSAPDLDALEAETARCREAEQAAHRSAGEARKTAETAKSLLNRLRDAERRVASAREVHGRIAGLAELTAGKNRLRLSFEGFVLASLLREVLAAANQHLARMLSGRFRLLRREEPERANAAIGLDIEMFDEWTGQARAAGTLSGGEGFCAALALALGLSETVQAHAGARRIDTLLIDEGFGSLDEEALEMAMEVLAGLEAGNRLAGVISHVAELKARIPARLEVTPGLRGSTARFVIA